MNPRRPFADLVRSFAHGSRFRVLSASSKAEQVRYWLLLTDEFIDVLIERDIGGYALSVGRSRIPPRVGELPGTTEGLYLWDDVRVALGDPELLSQPDSLEQVVRLVARLEDRLAHLFSDRSLARLRRVQQNRIATQFRTE